MGQFADNHFITITSGLDRIAEMCKGRRGRRQDDPHRRGLIKVGRQRSGQTREAPSPTTNKNFGIFLGKFEGCSTTNFKSLNFHKR